MTKHFAVIAGKDARLAALERRENLLQREAVRVRREVERRFAAYRIRLRERQEAIAATGGADAAAPVPPASAAPSVGVVSLPPATSTASS